MIWGQNGGWIFVKLETHRQKGLLNIAWSSAGWKNSESLPKFKRVQEIGTKKNPRLGPQVCKLTGLLKRWALSSQKQEEAHFQYGCQKSRFKGEIKIKRDIKYEASDLWVKSILVWQEDRSIQYHTLRKEAIRLSWIPPQI